MHSAVHHSRRLTLPTTKTKLSFKMSWTKSLDLAMGSRKQYSTAESCHASTFVMFPSCGARDSLSISPTVQPRIACPSKPAQESQRVFHYTCCTCHVKCHQPSPRDQAPAAYTQISAPSMHLSYGAFTARPCACACACALSFCCTRLHLSCCWTSSLQPKAGW